MTTPTSDPTPLMMDELDARCAYWQRRLRLQDWTVHLEISRACDLGMGTLGDCQVTATKRRAKVRILDPRDVAAHGFWDETEAYDWETTLVHELLHLHLHDMGVKWSNDEDPIVVAGERAIHAISLALTAESRATPTAQPDHAHSTADGTWVTLPPGTIGTGMRFDPASGLGTTD